MNRELLLELKEFLTERMVDNMSTKDLEEYVANDLFNYFTIKLKGSLVFYY